MSINLDVLHVGRCAVIVRYKYSIPIKEGSKLVSLATQQFLLDWTLEQTSAQNMCNSYSHMCNDKGGHLVNSKMDQEQYLV